MKYLPILVSLVWVPCGIKHSGLVGQSHHRKKKVDNNVFISNCLNSCFTRSTQYFLMATEFEEGTIIPNLALSVVIRPVIDEMLLEYQDAEEIQKIKKAFQKAEMENPGITQEILSGILKRESLKVNMNKSLLSCTAYETDEYMTTRQEKEFVKLAKQARALKTILSKIPSEIGDRSKFLQTIKDIASAIKDLLDAVNEVLKNCQNVGKMPQYKKVLEHNKKEFVKYSKSFSDTLKQYFKDGKADAVYVSANRLINQTNNILYTFKLAGGG